MQTDSKGRQSPSQPLPVLHKPMVDRTVMEVAHRKPLRRLCSIRCTSYEVASFSSLSSTRTSKLLDVRMATMTKNPRALFAVAAAAVVLFVLALISQHYKYQEKITAGLSDTLHKERPFGGEETYKTVEEKGKRTVIDHIYHAMHDRDFPTINKRVVETP